jgi:hypothetical protein
MKKTKHIGMSLETGKKTIFDAVALCGKIVDKTKKGGLK